MKKTNFWGFASILVVGALLFGLASCDTGAGSDDAEKAYNAEIPSTYYPSTKFSTDASENASTVTAKWTFTDNGIYATAFATSSTPAYTGTVVEPNEGSGATLVPGATFNCRIDSAARPKGNSVDSALTADSCMGALNFAKGTVTADDWSNASTATLTLSGQSNIKILALGSGTQDSTRGVAIADSDDNFLAYKLSMGNTTDTLLQVQAAPAGKYTVYANGVRIYLIDVSYDSTIVPVTGIDSLRIDDGLITDYGQIETAGGDGNYAVSLEVGQTLSLKAKTGDGDASGLTWYTSDSSVATVSDGLVKAVAAGETTIRARFGKTWTDGAVVVTVTDNEYKRVTYFAGSSIPTADAKTVIDFTTDTGIAILKGTSSDTSVTADSAEVTYGADSLFTGEAAFKFISKGSTAGLQLTAAPNSTVARSGINALGEEVKKDANDGDDISADTKLVTFKLPVKSNGKLKEVNMFAASGKGADPAASDKVYFTVKVGENGTESSKAGIGKTQSYAHTDGLSETLSSNGSDVYVTVYNGKVQKSVSFTVKDIVLVIE